jgi:hypothetical protein
MCFRASESDFPRNSRDLSSPIKFVAAEAGFLPSVPLTFLADIVSVAVRCFAICACDVGSSG